MIHKNIYYAFRNDFIIDSYHLLPKNVNDFMNEIDSKTYLK